MDEQLGEGNGYAAEDTSATLNTPFRPPRRASNSPTAIKVPTGVPSALEKFTGSIPVYPGVSTRGSNSPVPSDSSGTILNSSGSEWHDRSEVEQTTAMKPLKPQRSQSRPNTSGSPTTTRPSVVRRESHEDGALVNNEERGGSPNFLEEYGLQLEAPPKSPLQSPSSATQSGRGSRFFKSLSINSRNRSVSNGGTPVSPGTPQPRPLSARRISSPRLGTSALGEGQGNGKRADETDSVPRQATILSTDGPSVRSHPHAFEQVPSNQQFETPVPAPVSEAPESEQDEVVQGTSESLPSLSQSGTGVASRRNSDASRYSALSSFAPTPHDAPDRDAFKSANPSESGHDNGIESTSPSDMHGTGEALSGVDLVRSALASQSTASLGDSIDFDQHSTTSSRVWQPLASGTAGAFTSALSPSTGPPPVPRRPVPSSIEATSAMEEPQPETKAERKKREAVEKQKAVESAAAIKKEQKEAAALAKAQAADDKLRAKEAVAEERAREKTSARLAKDAAVEAKAKEKEEARMAKENAKRNAEKQKRDAVEQAILKSNWEDLEVARFLNDFGKHVHEARSVEPVEPHMADLIEWPNRAEWLQSSRGAFVGYIGYLLAWMTALTSYLSPSGATRITRRVPRIGVASTTAFTDEGFDLKVLRSNTERLYYSAVPLYESVFATARRLWRWDRFFVTFPLAVTYAFLWWQSALLPAFFGLQILVILKMRIFPPKPQTLREVLARQKRRHEAIAQLQQSLETGQSAEVLQEAEGAKRTDNSSSDSSSSHDSGRHRGRYSLAADVTRRYGRQATGATAAVADFHERLRNVGLWRSPSATWRYLSLLTVFLIASSLLTPAMLVRLPGLVVGLVFFLLGPIVEHRPHWLPTEFVVDPTWLLLAGVPNDAQCAVRILRKRARTGLPLVSDPSLLLGVDLQVVKDAEAAERENAEGGAGALGTVEVKKESLLGKLKSAQGHARSIAIKGSGVLAGERNIYLPRLNPDNEDASVKAFLARSVNRGLGQIEAQANKTLQTRATQEVDTTSNIDGAYWAVMEGNCGHLIVLPTRLVFRSTFAHKRSPISSEPLNSADATTDDGVPLIDATTGRAHALPEQSDGDLRVSVRTLLDISLEHVVGLRKRSHSKLVVWSSEGLELLFHNGKTVDLNNMLQRDVAFSRILAIAPQHWDLS